jgi:hypothetical protein
MPIDMVESEVHRIRLARALIPTTRNFTVVLQIDFNSTQTGGTKTALVPPPPVARSGVFSQHLTYQQGDRCVTGYTNDYRRDDMGGTGAGITLTGYGQSSLSIVMGPTVTVGINSGYYYGAGGASIIANSGSTQDTLTLYPPGSPTSFSMPSTSYTMFCYGAGSYINLPKNRRIQQIFGYSPEDKTYTGTASGTYTGQDFGGYLAGYGLSPSGSVSYTTTSSINEHARQYIIESPVDGFAMYEAFRAIYTTLPEITRDTFNSSSATYSATGSVSDGISAVDVLHNIPLYGAIDAGYGGKWYTEAAKIYGGAIRLDRDNFDINMQVNIDNFLTAPGAPAATFSNFVGYNDTWFNPSANPQTDWILYA